MVAVSVTLGSASSVASLSSGVQSVRLTLIVHAGDLGYKIYCISYLDLFSGNPDKCFCKEGFCHNTEWECHKAADCKKMKKCEGVDCTCRGNQQLND